MAETFDSSGYVAIVRGNKFEDFKEGASFKHHWGRTFTVADNVVFSSSFGYWHPRYLNRQYAREHGQPDVFINPMLVLSTVVGLSVEDLSEAGGPFLGVENCVFHKPVFPGDTISVTSSVKDARSSDSRPTMGIVTWETTARNQYQETVVTLERTNLVARRT